MQGGNILSLLFHYDDKYYYPFTKNGFTNELIDIAESNPKISLITFNDINK